MYSTPRMLQGVFTFEGRGLDTPDPVGERVAYGVPEGRRAQLVYFRAGNSAAELICVSLMRDGAVMRLFPLGAKSACHVSLAVIEDLLPGTELEVLVAAPEGVSGEVVLDVGIVESPDDGIV